MKSTALREAVGFSFCDVINSVYLKVRKLLFFKKRI